MLTIMILTLAGPQAADAERAGEVHGGLWSAQLESPGGALRFGLELRHDDGALRGWLINGDERIALPRVTVEADEVVLHIDHYDSIIRARIDDGRLDGQWRKRRGKDEWSEMRFHAMHSDTPRIRPGTPHADQRSFAGRWKVRFASDDTPAVAIFRTPGAADPAPETLYGTFLTSTGDYRYLAGRQRGERLWLSCFDGAHAFLFEARLQADGTLAGDFWSGNHWHDTWTATRDADVELPSGFEQSRWNAKAKLDELIFPDLDGKRRSLADAAFAGKARIIELFGSWCPNCHDAAALLGELDAKYRERGLSIVGLAFEVTGDFERDARQVRRYAERHGVAYPLLVAGLSDKAQASAAFPALDRVRAYPTLIFLDAGGRVRAVYTGFAGPAASEEHGRMRAEFERIIEELLDERGEGE